MLFKYLARADDVVAADDTKLSQVMNYVTNHVTYDVTKYETVAPPSHAVLMADTGY